MIGNEGVNIPVLFTGIAEVIACLIYVVLLKKKYGPAAIEDYNKLTSQEKESILKCLK